ncbi:MAG: aspartate aminotransferase family protein [Deltaproteobacteria bacterium]|nr:aspartate aminotransferase family protein [Deltaproteobacteria bacterium]
MTEKKIKFPQKGTDRAEVLARMQSYRDKDANWHDGRTWSLVYHAGDEHYEFLKKAHNMFFSENGLNPGAFPSLKRFEAEVVSMACDLLGGDADAVGNMTSGGTESILMAVKTYRDRARAQRPEIKQPEAILPMTVHPAFEKAMHYFDVKPVHVAVREDFRVDVEAAKKAITKNTILIVGSAPQYPHGVIDPIAELAAVALTNGIGMHVDSCVGGFLLPFVRKLGAKLPDFDFRVPGVTSMSADLHKYGFTAKGASVVLYRNRDLRRFQYFQYTDWPGGLFGSPSMCGTRPGGPIAAAWATFNAIGIEGYIEIAKRIMENTKKLQDGIRAIPGLYVLGEPVMSVFAFASENADIFAVADQMEARGWHIDRQQNPACLHLMVTPAHTPILDQYLSDLRESVAYVAANPNAATQGAAAMYGMMAKIPDRTQVRAFIQQYMDTLYDV